MQKDFFRIDACRLSENIAWEQCAYFVRFGSVKTVKLNGVDRLLAGVSNTR